MRQTPKASKTSKGMKTGKGTMKGQKKEESHDAQNWMPALILEANEFCFYNIFCYRTKHFLWLRQNSPHLPFPPN